MITLEQQRALWKLLRRHAQAFGDAMVASPTRAEPGWKAKSRDYDRAHAELASFIQSITLKEKKAS